MSSHLATPDAAAIALMLAFPLLVQKQITLVQTEAQALQAKAVLQAHSAWGFDTESKPTFHVGETSDGPHTVQLAVHDHAWVFQLHDPACAAVVGQLLALPHVVKAGFGLGDDCKRVRQRLGVEMHNVVELNVPMRQRGYRSEIGVKGAVAVLFGQRFAKSKKVSTSNWAQPVLSPAQLLYAANDAYAAWRVWQVLAPTTAR